MILRVEDLARPVDYAGALARLLDFIGGGADSHQSLAEHSERLKRTGAGSLCALRLRADPYEGAK